MAYFNQNTTGSSSSPEKAAGYINIYLPTKSGTRKKLGFVVFRESDEFHQAIIRRLTEGTEKEQELAFQSLCEHLVLEFNPVSADADSQEPEF